MSTAGPAESAPEAAAGASAATLIPQDAGHGIRRQVLVVMGVSGVGKTTIARALDDALEWPFQEGDDLHPPGNIDKMASGRSLTDEDRAPWLHAVAAWIEARRQAGEPGVITCSALRRSYRDTIKNGHEDVRIVYLRADRVVIAERLSTRMHHYMPADLLESQLATLEEPQPDENPLTVQVHGSVEEIAGEIVQRLRDA